MNLSKLAPSLNTAFNMSADFEALQLRKLLKQGTDRLKGQRAEINLKNEFVKELFMQNGFLMETCNVLMEEHNNAIDAYERLYRISLLKGGFCHECPF